MAAEDPVAEFHIPDTKYAFFLGCFERRVTIFSQQVRALNLADALVSAGIVRENVRVAVIGGGVAGVTFTAAAALACPQINEIVLFEKKSDLLHLQRPGRDRYIHPHLYDWPASSASRNRAGLPILDWTAGTATDVAGQIMEGFQLIQARSSKIRVCLGHEVSRVSRKPLSGCNVEIEGTKHEGGLFDVVVFAVGFGYERLVGEHIYSYWTSSVLQDNIPSPAASSVFFVSGNGDGGLVDFAMAVLGKAHQTIVRLISDFHGLDYVKEELLRIEEEAWQAGDDYDLLDQYVRRIALPADMPLRIYEHFRPNDTFILHTRDPHLFRKDTSILNRFIVFAIAQADQEKTKVRLIVGKEFEGGIPTTGPVRIEGEEPIEACYRYLRLGPNQEAVLEPFKEFADGFRTTRGRPKSGYRPATPSLSPSATSRFALFVQRTQLREASVTKADHSVSEVAQSSAAALSDRVEAAVQQKLAAISNQFDTGEVHAQNTSGSALLADSYAAISWGYAPTHAYKTVAFTSLPAVWSVQQPQHQPGAAEQTLIEAPATSEISAVSGAALGDPEFTQPGNFPAETVEVIHVVVRELQKRIKEAVQTIEISVALALARDLEETLGRCEMRLERDCVRDSYVLLAEIEMTQLKLGADGARTDAFERAKAFLSKAQNV